MQQIVGDVLVVAFATGTRSIANIIPDVVIEETHSDNLTITEHPIEQGASITDHAYKNAPELTMRVAWSNCKSANDRKTYGTVIAGRIEDIADAYSYLLGIQQNRLPIDVITGKRAYKNMLIKSLATSTDRRTNETLEIVVGFRQLIIVKTSTAKIEISNQSNPQVTAGTQNTGVKTPITLTEQLVAKPLSILNLNKGL